MGVIIFDFFYVTVALEGVCEPKKSGKCLSVRSICFELIRSTVTPEPGCFSHMKLYWALEEKEDSEEYDPETNRHDAVSVRMKSGH